MSKGDWLYYTGEECEKCDKESMSVYENGDEICEWCNWNETKQRYEK